MDYVVMPKNDWQEVLDATRERTGDSSLLRSGDVGAQIRAIPSGDGGITPSGTRRITENGTYDVTGYASAEVEVETPTEELSVTENGEYTPPVGKHFSKVTVNVEAADGGTSEDLTAELSEQDALLTEIEA
ncbi:MAG: hypothetical protein IKC26_00945, partial [Clostridia bacterium]|nr:hypothetical protein [Clostridia bacterium]